MPVPSEKVRLEGTWRVRRHEFPSEERTTLFGTFVVKLLHGTDYVAHELNPSGQPNSFTLRPEDESFFSGRWYGGDGSFAAGVIYIAAIDYDFLAGSWAYGDTSDKATGVRTGVFAMDRYMNDGPR